MDSFTSYVLKTSWRHLYKTFWRCLEDVFKTTSNVLKMSWRRFCKTSWRCLEDIFARRLEDVLKMSCKRLEDVWLRQIYWSWQRRFLKTYDLGEYIYLDQDILKTSPEDDDERRLHQDECLLGVNDFRLVKRVDCLARAVKFVQRYTPQF